MNDNLPDFETPPKDLDLPEWLDWHKVGTRARRLVRTGDTSGSWLMPFAPDRCASVWAGKGRPNPESSGDCDGIPEEAP